MSQTVDCILVKIAELKSLLMLVWYIDPKTYISELNSLLQKLPSSNVYLTGDINTDLLKSSISDFEDIMYGNGFVPLISIYL